MRIAVSACLLGVPCRFDGQARPCEAVIKLKEHHELVPVCPEQMGGLAVPHPPSEIDASSPQLRVVSADGTDVTEAFVAGARAACAKAVDCGCELAIMKEKSPSCGTGRIYDGSFTRTLVNGDGVAVRLLREAGIPVIGESADIDRAIGEQQA